MAELVDAAKKLAHDAMERGVQFPKVHNRTQINEFCGSALVSLSYFIFRSRFVKISNYCSQMDTNTPEGFDMEAAMENLIKKYGTHDIPGGGTKSQQAAQSEDRKEKMVS